MSGTIFITILRCECYSKLTGFTWIYIYISAWHPFIYEFAYMNGTVESTWKYFKWETLVWSVKIFIDYKIYILTLIYVVTMLLLPGKYSNKNEKKKSWANLMRFHELFSVGLIDRRNMDVCHFEGVWFYTERILWITWEKVWGLHGGHGIWLMDEIALMFYYLSEIKFAII